MSSGCRLVTAQPGSPPITARTSPTSTETTGVLQASASFTATGEPSEIEVITMTSAAATTRATSCRSRSSRRTELTTQNISR